MSNKGKRYPRDPLTREEVEALLVACGQGRRGARDRALLTLLYRGAIRVGEAVTVRYPEDVREVEGRLHVRIQYPKGWNPQPRADGKRRKPTPPRTVALDERGTALVMEWIAVRGDAPGPLLVTSRGHRMWTSHARRLCRRLRVKAGITRRVHPHGFRHTCAGEMQREGSGLREIQAVLGHARPSTTDTYLRESGLDAVAIEATSRREW